MSSSTNSKRHIFLERSEAPKKFQKMSTKTPITILQELCAKKDPRNLPAYTELQTAPDELEEMKFTFFIRCQALGKEAVGGGLTKRIAKHTSAENLLKKILARNNNDDHDSDSDNRQTQPDKNAIGDLLNFCVVKNFSKPDFQCISSVGPSHAPSFTIQCQLNSIIREATAGNKQQAKQMAARKVYDEIIQNYPDVEKKIAIVNDPNQAHAQQDFRKKITTYRELKELNKTGSMGVTIRERNNFFVNQEDQDLVQELQNILRTELKDDEKIEKLLEKVKTQWDYKFEKFADTDLMVFELLIDFEVFTVVLMAPVEELNKEILEYFCSMLHVNQMEAVPLPAMPEMFVEQL